MFSDECELKQTNINFNEIQHFADEVAWEWLRIIHLVPENWDSVDHLFVYPNYVQTRNPDPYLKGFANPQLKDTSQTEHAEKIDPSNSSQKLSSNDKLTMFFDVYQKYAFNFDAILGGIKNYSHLPYDLDQKE